MRNTAKTLNLVYIAIGATLTAVCSWISIPTIVPFTLQTFAIFILLLLLGGKRGTLSIIVYILLGMIGLPVFSGFASGPGVLLGTTGGYIIGFIFMGLIYLAFEKLFADKMLYNITALFIGLIVCYAFGSLWFMYVYMHNTGEVAFTMVLTWCVIPFIIPDITKMALAVFISKRVKRIIK